MNKNEDIDYSKGEIFEKRNKVLPTNLTSYDLLKTIAIILMIIDHVGHYFFPDVTWLRILGRLCVPIWFFLIGYARTRDIPFRIILGLGILLGANLIAGEKFFPLSILLTLMIGRYYIDAWMGAVFRGGEALAGLFFMLALLGAPTAIAFEYGTFGLLFTVFGAMCRYRQERPDLMPENHNKQFFFFTLASFLLFIGVQSAPMEVLTGWHFRGLVAGMAGVYFILNRFQPVELPTITARLPKFVVNILQFTGRRTLEIYVAHLVAFKLAAMYYMPERFQFLQWQWTHENIIEYAKFIFTQ